ncbi:hypothetical protein ACFZA9_11995 [Streptomyces olivaceus]
MSAPTCCGRTMGSSGGQWVCGRCGSWVDPGTAPRPAPPLAVTEAVAR